jgi:hypothetical protein
VEVARWHALEGAQLMLFHLSQSISMIPQLFRSSTVASTPA